MTDKQKPRSRWRTVDFILPTGAFRRAASSIGKTVVAVKKTASDMRDALPDQTQPGKYEEGDLRNISDARERFIAMYELHDWTEEELVAQVKTLKRTKITAICVSFLSLAGIVLLATTAPLWASIFLIPASGSMLILGFAQGFKYALYEAQISLREFISAREFASRDDFWIRLLG